MIRTTRDVVLDHLRRRMRGDLEGDLRENYHPAVRLLSAEGVHHGHDGVRHLAAILRTYVQDGDYQYRQVLVDGDVGMLVWSGRCSAGDIALHDGVDTYVVRDGLLVAQTIHYSSGAIVDHPDA
ncbi:nuclear transport factor 2 family protein [Micromonospora musae]|uniref:Nuclear transport factor 2 family protein n=1 Tax=Micromonospora musae TaxID=1894970 RepID=A0A3A9YI37_9ACTN|nr:nuclear transport factor 2 family protein [Micromonospora musae]RKN21314.1 nuclear transport factor 2 family protein [Micromonospora musae]RKN36343.1 nuclear transport factor 2 family protein [Micromonospora musae]